MAHLALDSEVIMSSQQMEQMQQLQSLGQQGLGAEPTGPTTKNWEDPAGDPAESAWSITHI